jgi:hypothetical protein
MDVKTHLELHKLKKRKYPEHFRGW